METILFIKIYLFKCNQFNWDYHSKHFKLYSFVEWERVFNMNIFQNANPIYISILSYVVEILSVSDWNLYTVYY